MADEATPRERCQWCGRWCAVRPASVGSDVEGDVVYGHIDTVGVFGWSKGERCPGSERESVESKQRHKGD